MSCSFSRDFANCSNPSEIMFLSSEKLKGFVMIFETFPLFTASTTDFQSATPVNRIRWMFGNSLAIVSKNSEPLMAGILWSVMII